MLWIASKLSQEGRHREAMGFLSDDRWLFSSVPSDPACEGIIEVYRRAGDLHGFFNARCAGRPREFVMAIARALIRMDLKAEAALLLGSRPDRIPGESRLLVEALLFLGREEDALAALEEMTRAEWSQEEYLKAFGLALKLGRWDAAEAIYPRVVQIRPIASDPGLHYDFARACERAGRVRQAGEVYRRFISEDVGYRDVIERYRRLKEGTPAPPPEPPAPAEALAQARPVPGQTGAGPLTGRYDLLSMIGQGGMGQVFDGRDRLLGRRVALKKMRPEFRSNPGLRERFVKEARLVSQLVHPNIVSVHDIVESEGDVFVVMDFVDGRSLAEILYARRRLGLEECRAIFQCVCEAVDFAHRSRILHRDLKPDNVMLDAGGHPKVMDFGLARQAKDTLSQITQLDCSGTPAYMAPEQHLGKAVRASDVYSLGVTLYEALTGQLPFPGPDFLAQKERQKFPPPQFLAPGLPQAIEPLMASVLDPDPAKRVQEAGELYAALKALSL